MSIVRELQRLALDSKSDITELLTKTYFAARKLKVKDMEKWANDELSGYQDHNTVPFYRKVRGQVMALNPMRGWMPVQFKSAEQAEANSKLTCALPIAQIQQLLVESKSGTVHASFGNQHNISQNLLSDMGPVSFQTTFEIGLPQIQGLVAAVRKQVLDWSMQLEEDGILGEDMNFNEKEIQTAATHNYTTNNIFQGNVSNSQIQGTAISSSQSMTIGNADFETKLQEIVDNIKTAKGATSDQIELAEAHADTLKSQAQLPPEKRSSGVIDKATKSLSVISSTLSIARNVKELLPALLPFLS